MFSKSVEFVYSISLFTVIEGIFYVTPPPSIFKQVGKQVCSLSNTGKAYIVVILIQNLLVFLFFISSE